MERLSIGVRSFGSSASPLAALVAPGLRCGHRRLAPPTRSRTLHGMHSYQRALGSLPTMSTTSISPWKGQIRLHGKQLQGLSNKLWRDTGYAKSALNQLPVNGTELSATYNFLSQLGSFCVAPV